MEMKVCLVATGFFLLLGAGTVAATPGKITADSASVIVIGSDIKLTCSMSDNTPLLAGTVGWKKDSTAVIASANIELTGSKEEVLRIVKTAQSDAGAYTCKPPGKVDSPEFKLTMEEPKKPTLKCTPTEIKVGETTKCTCESTNDPRIVPRSYVFKVAGTAETAEGKNTPKNELVVTGTMALDGKEVTCQAKFHNDASGLSVAAAVKLTTINQPKLECFPPIVPVGRVIKCTCTSLVSTIPHGYIFKVDGVTKTAEGPNTPQNQLSVTGTMALDNKDLSCAVEYKDLGETSAVATVELAVFSTCTCTATPTKVAGVSVMTTGFVLLLSTLLMKE